MLKDFKAFILRGNVVDLAIAVVIGTAFGTLVTSFVENLLTPLIAIPGSQDFSDLDFTISDSTFGYGKVINALMARRKTEPDVESITKECDFCLSNVPAAAIVCAFCTREIDRPRPVTT